MAKFCSNCGNELDEKAYICPKCGVKVNKNQVSNNNDSGSIGYGILGFFLPLVGLILYLCWKNESPKNAKTVGKGALIGLILFLIIFIISFYIFFKIEDSIDGGYNYEYDYDYNLKLN